MERPLSPFMFPIWYRFQISSALSILHRLTGIGLALGSILLAWWLIAVAAARRRYRNPDPEREDCRLTPRGVPRAHRGHWLPARLFTVPAVAGARRVRAVIVPPAGRHLRAA